MSTQAFNMFKVLEKDDKELIHSSFLMFLLTENDTLYRNFFGIEDVQFSVPTLEKPYNIPNKNSKNTKSDRRRIDIEIESLDEKHIVVIENKFKSFPSEEQLSCYDELYATFHKDKRVRKYLLCFDKSLISFKTDWTVYDYNDLLLFIEKNYLSGMNLEKQIFIKHYHAFLSEYYNEYRNLKENCKVIFQNCDDSDNKFWLRLFYSALQLELAKYFKAHNVSIQFAVDRGSTKVPLINIIPKGWTIQGRELLIQFQGDDLKFYSHSNDKKFIERIVTKARKKFYDEEFEMKKMTKRDANTYFIFKTKLTAKLGEGKFTLASIKEVVINFYEDIDREIIGSETLTLCMD